MSERTSSTIYALRANQVVRLSEDTIIPGHQKWQPKARYSLASLDFSTRSVLAKRPEIGAIYRETEVQTTKT